MKRCAGITLTELLVVIAVAAVLAGLGGPAMGVFLKNNKLRNVSFEVLASLNFARGEAISRKRPVVICRSANMNTCQTGGGSWGSGWLVFVSNDNNLTLDAGEGPPIRTVTQTVDTIRLGSNATAGDAMRFLPDGTADTNGATALLYVCDDRGTTHGREVEIAPHGRARIVAGTTANPITACPP